MMRHVIFFDFIDEFICDGKYCDSSCCGNWGIEIDKYALAKYRGINDKKLREKIKKNMFYNHDQKKHYFLLNKKGKCSFLDSDGLCCIQKNVGEEYLTDVCAIYPRKYVLFDDYVIKSLSLSCPVAARMLLKENNTLLLVDKIMNLKRDRVIEKKTVSPKLLQRKWLDIQLTGIKILQFSELSIRERVFNLCMFCDGVNDLLKMNCDLEEVDSLINGILKDEQQRELAKLSDNINMDMSLFIIDMFSIVNDFLSKKGEILITDQDEKYINMLEKYFKLTEKNDVDELMALYKKAEYMFREYISKNYPFLKENYLVYQWFRTTQPIMYDGNIVQSISMFLLFYKLQEFLLILLIAQEKNIQEHHIVECISYVTNILEHQHIYFEVCLNYLRKNNYSIIEMIKIWLSDGAK